MPRTKKDSANEFSKKRPLLLIEQGTLFSQTFAQPTIPRCQWLRKEFVNVQHSKQHLGLQLRKQDLSILIIAVEESQDAFALGQYAKSLSPHLVCFLMLPTWTAADLLKAVNELGVFRILTPHESEAELQIHLRAALIQSDLTRTQIQLTREVSQRNRALEALTQDLEKTVNERTQHIQQSKEEMDSKLDLVRQLIRFIKGLSKTADFEELMGLLRKDLKRFAKLGDPILLVQSKQQKMEVISFRSTGYTSLIVPSDLKFTVDPLGAESEDLRLALVKLLGRPFVRILSLPLSLQLSRKNGFSEAAALLCIECAMTDSEQAQFLIHLQRLIRPFSLALDRAFLQQVLTMQSLRWEKTFNGLRDPLAIIDKDYNVLHANKKFSERLHLKTCYESFAQRSSPCEGCPQPAALQKAETHSQQLQIAGRTYQVSAYPIQSSTTVVLQYVDVTQSRELYARLLQNEKMSALGLLAGNIAHELNNPLSGIRSLAQILVSESPAGSTLQTDFQEIEKAAARSQNIIKNLVDFSSGAGQKRQVIELAEIVEKTMPLLKTVIRNQRCQLQLGDQSIKVNVDAQLMQQVVFNLISNACQAMENGGDLQVVVRHSQDQAELLISDQGPGVPVHLREKIFEPFFTTKPEGQGTGLGLSLSRDIVRKMGGDLTVSEAAGGGSDFHVLLPLFKENLKK